MTTLDAFLEQSAALHRHLCPRQVLGVRMGILAGSVLGIAVPQSRKQLLAIVETDGCFCDGIVVAANCSVGRRTMRIEDHGKVAAAFIDTKTGCGIRIVPHPEARQRAWAFAPEARSKWEAQLHGYQQMPSDLLFLFAYIELSTPVHQIISRPGVKTRCELCGEEIINHREVLRDGKTLCRACAAPSYYRYITGDCLGLCINGSEVNQSVADPRIGSRVGSRRKAS